jgi:hypothetical protein
MVDEQAQNSYRRTIIHDHRAILKLFRDFPHNQRRLQRLSVRGGQAVVMDAADIHTHIDHLFSRYAQQATLASSIASRSLVCC